MNLCTDQLAIAARRAGAARLGEPRRPRPARLGARGGRRAAYPTNRAQAEEIFLLAPTSCSPAPTTTPRRSRCWSARPRVERFPLETSIEDIRANLRRMGALLGAEAAAEAMVAEMDAALGGGAGAGGGRPRAALQYSNSYTSGGGHARPCGARGGGPRNLAAELGITGMARLPLETLILARPDLIVTGQDYPRPRSRRRCCAIPRRAGSRHAGGVAVPRRALDLRHAADRRGGGAAPRRRGLELRWQLYLKNG
jgi:iron complex transport system substrate-binding protein